MSEREAFKLGEIIWKARIVAAWAKESAKLRLRENPWPEHEAAERAASHDLAIASARAILNEYRVTPIIM
jgi:hypothetical protein